MCLYNDTNALTTGEENKACQGSLYRQITLAE